LTLGRPKKEASNDKDGKGKNESESVESGAKDASKEERLDSDDEEIDEQQLKRGELEG
jgi:hypothetical protein